MKRGKKLLNIFYIFAILGIQMFGNLATMIPIFERDLINKRKLITKDDLLDSITIGRCGPGAAIINTVSFLGNRIDGILGALFAVIGFVFFPFIVIVIISFLLNQFLDNILLNNFFTGVLSFMTILIAKSMIEFGKSTLVDKITVGIFIVTIVISIFVDIPVVANVVIVEVISIILRKMN